MHYCDNQFTPFSIKMSDLQTYSGHCVPQNGMLLWHLRHSYAEGIIIIMRIAHNEGLQNS